MSGRRLMAVLAAATMLPAAGWAAPPALATTEHVAIIVIDNFGGAPPQPVAMTDQSNCTYAPEDSNVVGDRGAGDGMPPGVSHGMAVQSQLSAQLDATSRLVPLSPGGLAPYGLVGMEGIRPVVERWTYNAQEVVLIGMETNGYTTLELARRLTEVRNALRLSPSRITRMVLNLSFVIVPCNVPAWLRDIGGFDADQILAAYGALLAVHPELGDLGGALADFPTDPAAREARLVNPRRDDPLLPLRRVAAPAEFYGLADPDTVPLPETPLRQRLHSDPLHAVLSGLAAAPVVPVAAAGNGLYVFKDGKLVRTHFQFPFAPALWNPVVAASGGQDWAQRAEYSNNGEVVLDGKTWVVPAGGGNAVQVQGSSFAAPRLSASVAVYLLTGGPSPCDGHLPVLGYTDSGRREPQHWLDLPLNQAAAQYCAGYGAHTTL